MINKCWKCDGEGILPSESFMKWRNSSKESINNYLKNHPSKKCDICYGKGMIDYSSIDEYVNFLVERWHKETHFSSTFEKKHPCMKAIVDIGEKAVPTILKDIDKEHSWVFTILRELVDDLPEIPIEIMGKLDSISEFFLDWGIEKGYISEKSEHIL